MKKVVKGIKLITFSLLILLIQINNPTATKLNFNFNTNRINAYEIYEIKENSLPKVNSIVEFYEIDPNKETYLKEKMKEYRLELQKEEEKRQQRLNLKTKIVNFSVQFVGNPYVSGGTSLTNGADCSGFVQAVFKNFNITLPRTAPDQAKVGEEVDISSIEIGDIISYGYNGSVGHSAIYIGDNKIVHSSTPELGIRIDNMNIMPIISIRRVIN